MLQRARRVEGHACRPARAAAPPPCASAPPRTRRAATPPGRASSSLTRPRLLGVGRVVAQQVRVVLDHRAAARRVDHDAPRRRPPVAATRRRCCGARRRARPRGRRGDGGWRRSSPSAPRRSPGCRSRRARAPWRRRSRASSPAARSPRASAPCARAARPGQRARARAARAPSSRSAAGSSGRTACPARIAAPNRPRRVSPSRSAARSSRSRSGRAHLRVDQLAADVDQLAVPHAGRAGGLAVAAGQAAVEVRCVARGRRGALQHLLDQIDAPARPVELVAEQLVGRDRSRCRSRSARSCAGWPRPRCRRGCPCSQSARWVSIVSEIRIHAAGIEDAGGIELALQALVDRRDRGGQRLEDACASVSPPRNSVAWPPTLAHRLADTLPRRGCP